MDLKIKDVAELLNISETTVRRWITEGKIPVYRLNHQFRFSRSEIEDWVLSCRIDQQKGFTSFSEPPYLQSENKKKQLKKQPLKEKAGTMQFSCYRAMHHGDVLLDVEGENKEQIIRNSMKRIANKMECDEQVLYELLMDREQLMPTSLNHGIAVPHTRDLLLQEDFDFIFVVFPKKPIEYGALDGQAVHTLFFLFACTDKRHLHLLAKLAHISSDQRMVEFLKTKPQRNETLEYIKEFESSIPAIKI